MQFIIAAYKKNKTIGYVQLTRSKYGSYESLMVKDKFMASRFSGEYSIIRGLSIARKTNNDKNVYLNMEVY